jgi:hypothetical protein
MKRSPFATGYAAPVGDLMAYAHADGSLSFEAPNGAAVDLTPEQAIQLAELLSAASGLRRAARRRRARTLYQQRHPEEV